MEFFIEKERIYAADEFGNMVAEVTFPAAGGMADINHTFVDESLRGHGTAAHLMEMAYAEICRQGNQPVFSCSYAKKWAEKNNLPEGKS